MNTHGGLTETGADVGRLTYSVDFEEEADYVGTYIAARAGYNISRAIAYWRRMSEQEPEMANGGIDHPSNPERFIALQKTIDEINYKRKNHIPLLPDVKKDVTNNL